MLEVRDPSVQVGAITSLNNCMTGFGSPWAGGTQAAQRWGRGLGTELGDDRGFGRNRGLSSQFAQTRNRKLGLACF